MTIITIPKLSKNAKDITGLCFGNLTVIEPTKKKNRGGCVKWRCLCSCGNICEVSSTSLRSGHTKSCGCLHREQTRKCFTTHGKSKTPIYNTWKALFQRCENPNNPSYKNYGGRSIKVCERWHTFENFYADMGECPPGLTLERKDNDKGYYPENCVFATWKEQNNNHRPISFGRSKQRWFYGHGPNGEIIVENNQNYVANAFGLCRSCISTCLHKKREHYKGWTFEFIKT